MSAHFTYRRDEHPFSLSHKSQIRHIDRPHLLDAKTQTSALEVIFLIVCVMLLMGLIIFLIYSCLHSFEWFRNMIDSVARDRYNAERNERVGLYAGRGLIGAGGGVERAMLCHRSAYLGGGREYGWRVRAYGDGSGDQERYETTCDLSRGSDSSGGQLSHRDDCEGQCGLATRRESWPAQ